jgi:protein FAM50
MPCDRYRTPQLTDQDRASTPAGEGTPIPKKKKRKTAKKGALSFADEEAEDDATDATSAAATPARSPSASSTPNLSGAKPGKSATPHLTDDNDGASDSATDTAPALKKRLKPNAAVGFVPKAQTKSALLREAQTRENLRKEFLALQERVRATEIALPFVFYDGSDIPGGICRVKKGDPVWLFLDKARKVGAEIGAGGVGAAGAAEGKSRREWARVSVDDLMLVRGEVMIPHHYDFHYFISNKTQGFKGAIFPYSDQPTDTSPLAPSEVEEAEEPTDPLVRPGGKKGKKEISTIPDEKLEGYTDDPTLTKVVDRRWYERNKHIFPASVWEEFEPEKDFSKTIRKDQSGNAFFF